MALGPLLPGRLPASLVSARLMSNLAQQNRLIGRLQDQVATGQKFFLPSESPAAAVKTILLQKTLERREQLETNVATSQSLLSATEVNLNSVTDALNRAKAFSLAGIGDTSSAAEREAMAIETAAMLQGVLNSANASFRGRYLFGGSESRTAPFEDVGGGIVRYNGDRLAVNAYVDLDLLQANNVDGATAFSASTVPITADVNPALTLQSRIADLHAGRGLDLGPVRVTVDDGVNPVTTATVDLSSAETIGDLKSLLEGAFPPGSLTVDIDPGSSSGLRLQAAASVAVADLAGSTVAADLGIAAAAAATITGGDLDPRLTELTALASLNGGTGIGATAGTGLVITNGTKTATIDLSTATTVEDLFNQIRAADLDLLVGINADGNGLAITSRLSGAGLSIGENGGTNAAGLGIRTFDGTTQLADLNDGRGVPVDDVHDLQITRRDGTLVTLDLAGMQTVQQVLDAVNAVDPGNLVASLNAVGNGITLIDGPGTGLLSVLDNELAVALGIAGTETGNDPLVPLVGQDVNPQRPQGVFTLLSDLETALRAGDDETLTRISGLIQGEIERLNLVRGDVGTRTRLLDDLNERLLDQEVVLEESLSVEFHTDLTEAIAQFSTAASTLQATMKLASQTLQLSLLNFL